MPSFTSFLSARVWVEAQLRKMETDVSRAEETGVQYCESIGIGPPIIYKSVWAHAKDLKHMAYIKIRLYQKKDAFIIRFWLFEF